MQASSRTDLTIHDVEVPNDELFTWKWLVIITTVVEVHRDRRLVHRVAIIIVQRGGLVGVDRRKRHAVRRVPVPEWQRKGVVADELAEDPFVEI